MIAVDYLQQTVIHIPFREDVAGKMIPTRSSEELLNCQTSTDLSHPPPRSHPASAAGTPLALTGPARMRGAGARRHAEARPDIPGTTVLQGLQTTFQHSESKPPPPRAQRTLVFCYFFFFSFG